MLRSLKEILGYEILSLEGRAGRVDDFVFDLETWRIRYVIADLGTWLEPRKVLIATDTCKRPKWEGRILPVNMTREQVRFSPTIRLQEAQAFEESRHPDHRAERPEWNLYRIGEVPHVITVPMPSERKARFTERRSVQTIMDEPELRAVGRVIGFRIRARNDEAGLIDDFIADDENWTIRFLIGAVRKIFPGRKVMFAPLWVNAIDSEEETVRLGLKPETLYAGPEYEPGDPVNRQVEEVIYDYHGRPKYRL